jgi:hypothetical protein
VHLKLTPDPNAPDVGAIKPNEPVTVTGTRGGYALVETSGGARGYAPPSALKGHKVPADQPAAASPGGVRELAGSNAARRDGFAESIGVSESAAATGFEVAG